MPPLLRIGYVPEHFSTPLHFASTHFSLRASLTPFPSGTGHMVTSLRAGEIDIGIGLTEGWVAGLSLGSASASISSSCKDGREKGEKVGGEKVGGEEEEFKIVGTYVESPLCWAISTGAGRGDISDVGDLRGKEKKKKKMGVSRIGSGSYVMGFVLAEREGWLASPPPPPPPPPPSAASPSSAAASSSDDMNPPFEIQPLQTFENLRKAVNDHAADFFMWEYFTSKRYYDSQPDTRTRYPIKKVGEIYTPWSSWKIVARSSLIGGRELEEVFEKLNAGVRYFKEHGEEAVRYISSELDYGEDDAREWMRGVRFAEDVRGVRRGVLGKTVESLKKAGVLGESGREMEEWVGIWKEE
ncbi:MAG: hypothetical protein Q9216_004772 [Gyalolechia sp. 2 TL-2023]